MGVDNKDLVKRMCESLRHRGPDSEGFFFNDKVGLGIRRLRIIDLVTGDQPIYDERREICVIHNGEIYNFRSLRRDLEKKGHRFYTKTDTEVIVHLYEDHGEECVKYLEGMFCFALWDKNKKKLLIGRDPIGIKQFYYTLKDGCLYFASELKALLENRELSREIDLEALNYYLTFLYIPAPCSIFKGINKLLPGHTLTYEDRSIKLKQYWDLKIKRQREMPAEELRENLYALLKETVRKHLISDVPLGVFLSGGMDSSSIVGLMAESGVKSIKTFSIGYEKEDDSFNELKYSRLAADYFKTDHHEFIVRPKAAEILSKLVWHLDEPFADSSAVPTFIVSEMAKQDVSAALSGIGGDEAYGGYPRYIGADMSQYYERLPLMIRRGIANFVRRFPETTKSRDLINWARRFVDGALLSDFERYIYWISFLEKEDAEKIYTDSVFDQLKGHDARSIHKNYFDNTFSRDYLDKIFYLDVKSYLADDLLVMADRMSMANSLELRVPYCDHKLLEFAASIPVKSKIGGYRLKRLFKDAMAHTLPPEIIGRKKQGFMIPVGRWLKDELKDMTMDLLSEANVKRRGYFNYEYIRQILQEHYGDRRNHCDKIWSLLTFELWCRIYMDKR